MRLAASLACCALALHPAVAPVLAQSTPLSPLRVGVLLQFEDKPSRRFVRDLSQEMQRIFRPTGLAFHFQSLDDGSQAVYQRVVLVVMKGRCDPTLLEGSAERVMGQRALGTTLLIDGEVAPLSVVDCDAIARMVANFGFRAFPRIVGWPFFVRLTGRVLAHELLHVLLRSAAHGISDCTRPRLSTRDLHDQARLEPAEVLQLRRLGSVPDRPLLLGRQGAGLAVP